MSIVDAARKRRGALQWGWIAALVGACGTTPAPVAYPPGYYSPFGNDGGFSGGDVSVDVGGGGDVSGRGGDAGDVAAFDAASVDAAALDAASVDSGPVDTGQPPCEPTVPPEEKCDGVDNDCDGETDEASCDIGNPCTVGKCDSAKALAGEDGCVWSQPTNLPCEDGDKCTGPDLCKGGACVSGEALACDDDNTCTLDGCSQETGKCAYQVFNDGIMCNDGKPCTTPDKCKAGKCKGQLTSLCDDGEPCTSDDCDASGTCLHAPQPGVPCTDGDACTLGDLCGAGKCLPGKAATCDDGNGCTADSCAPKSGCQHQPKKAGLECSDGVCKKGGKCSAQGLCQGEVDLCDDDDPCTTDTCTTSTGCLHAQVAENTICGPGALCKTGAKVSTTVKGKANMPIPDNNPIGVNDTIDFPDKGTAESIAVHVSLENSDVSGVRIELFDPTNAKYLLYDKGGVGTKLDTTWPTLSQPLSGNLLSWIGKNPKGKWRIIVYDLKFKDNTIDGKVTTWSVTTQAASNKMLCVQP